LVGSGSAVSGDGRGCWPGRPGSASRRCGR
jgi:hypothetical protein